MDTCFNCVCVYVLYVHIWYNRLNIDIYFNNGHLNNHLNEYVSFGVLLNFETRPV